MVLTALRQHVEDVYKDAPFDDFGVPSSVTEYVFVLLSQNFFTQLSQLLLIRLRLVILEGWSINCNSTWGGIRSWVK